MGCMSDVVTAPAPAVTRTPLTYKDSGVDIDAGDEVVDRIKGLLKRTHGPRVMGQHGAFAGMFRLDYNQKLFKNNYRDPVLVGYRRRWHQGAPCRRAQDL